MSSYLKELIYYTFAYVVSLYALSALDFNRLLKKNRVGAAWVLYIVVAMIMAYLLGTFLMKLINL